MSLIRTFLTAPYQAVDHTFSDGAELQLIKQKYLEFTELNTTLDTYNPTMENRYAPAVRKSGGVCSRALQITGW